MIDGTDKFGYTLMRYYHQWKGCIVLTNREIAQKLKVSPAALSLIINGKPGISDSTRTRIISQLQEMGLEHLIKKPAPSVGENAQLCFVVYKKTGEILDTHSFFLLLLETVETCARSYHYDLMLHTIDERRPLPEQFKQLAEKKTSGAILFATEMTDRDMEPFLNLPFPVFALDNDFTRLNCNSLSINNRMGTAQAIEYLINMGHTRIGYLASNIQISSFIERKQGYHQAMAEHGMSFAKEDIIPIRYAEDDCFHDVQAFLQNHKGSTMPSAFVCDDDTAAIGAMRAFTACGFRIPEDISIIGFNNRPSCELTSPPLTTINVFRDAMASQAVHELVRQIREPEQYAPEVCARKLRLGTQLVERESVKRV